MVFAAIEYLHKEWRMDCYYKNGERKNIAEKVYFVCDRIWYDVLYMCERTSSFFTSWHTLNVKSPLPVSSLDLTLFSLPIPMSIFKTCVCVCVFISEQTHIELVSQDPEQEATSTGWMEVQSLTFK